jgi:Dullard-like phosphatase family protein
MLFYRSRLSSAWRSFAKNSEKYTNSDDDILFSNESIESNYVPKSNSLFRRGLRFIIKGFTYGSMILFGYTFYLYKNKKNYLEYPGIVDPILSAVIYTDNIYKVFQSLLMDPPLDKLLPDLPKMPPGYMTPKTLVLDLKGTLLSTEYELGKGYIIMKRPGLTEFLNKMSQMYEVVILCDEETFFTSQLASSLDPNHKIFSATMGRECLCIRGGELVKDLKYLNRDLRNVIIIDKNPNMVRLQPDNAILVSEFKGNEEDKALVELIPFLEHIVKDRVVDVREEIKKYGHAETGKKYLEKLEKIRDSLIMKQNTGFNRLFTKKNPQKIDADSIDLTPKPPS